MELEEYKFDHFKNIDEVMYYFNYWYKEEDVYSINRYLSLKDFNYISNKYQGLQKENKQLQERIEYLERSNNRREDIILEQRQEINNLETQQKEFIKWLEDYLNLFDYRDIQEQAGYDMLEEILQKYKKIIGE